MRFPFGLRNPFYRPRHTRLYTDTDLPAHEWLQVWTPEQLQAWKDSKAEEWHRMPGAPILDPNISRNAIPPVEREFTDQTVRNAEAACHSYPCRGEGQDCDGWSCECDPPKEGS